MFYTGKNFNDNHRGEEFVKLTNNGECHNGFKYKDGLNIDTENFVPEGTCKSGGLYFVKKCDMFKWIKYNPKIGIMVWYRDVTIPDSAQVWDESDKSKCDRFILGPKLSIQKYINEYSEPTQLVAVTQNGYAIDLIEDPSESIQLAAVHHRDGVTTQENGLAI
jgi:hypothetical protein